MYQEALGQTVNTMLDYSCDRWGQREALVYGDERLTFFQLRRRVATLAAALQDIGVGKGDKVAFLLGVTPDWVVLFYAAMRLGAIAVPLNMTWVGREIEEGLALTDANVLVVVDDFRGVDYVSVVAEQLDGLSGSTPDAVACPRLPHLRTIITTSKTGKTYPFAYDLRQLETDGGSYDAGRFRGMSAEVGPDAESIFLLTSGTTSFPKPVIHTHQSLLVGVAGYADGIEAHEGDSILIIAPNYHVAGYLTLLMPHLRGAPVHLMEFYVPDGALDIIERERISLVFGFDVHFLMMARHPRFTMYDISSITRTMIGSSPSSFDEIAAMGITHQGNIYGSSEYVASQAYFPYRDRHDVERMRLSHGRPMLGSQVRIIDPGSGQTLGPDQPGEICIKGPALFKGYYNMPEETAAAFDADGFFHSGDYGWLDSAGYVYYRGRYKETIKTGGENVSAQEVELFLQMETPWIQKALVVAVPDEKWGEAVTAVVEVKPGHRVSEEDIREYCRGRLAGYKIPKRVVFVGTDDWVVTPTGKLDRGAMARRANSELGVSR
ncbi:class I adenylate-forming enzyme family protein [Sphaerisporangium sp. NPDC088356]|uniref:class I adenylate-forming enzyme family protein n=1 Tax=Sphaerisporangium sp. NPDC088356 TaxID=3154871 RepID=UPI003433074F